ncbi:MAG TPA: FtsX-like permease family protein, partial [Afifellaceae bacterium]|nr:FtsX-like permease family protein [Afifellaceae bacterium]
AEVRWGAATGPWKRVVGVAGRAIYKGLEDRDGLPVLYVCSNQYQTSSFSLLLRTTRPVEVVIREARTKLQEIDPELYLVNPTSLEVPLGNLHLERQGTTLLTGVFAALALFVSAIGIYGLLAYDVQQRRREFGIRAAIGAGRLQVLTMVLQQGLWKTGLGLVLGLFGAFVVSRYLSSLLFDVSALDPVTYLAVALGLSLVALTASLIPARRATKVDPVIALRAE